MNFRQILRALELIALFIGIPTFMAMDLLPRRALLLILNILALPAYIILRKRMLWKGGDELQPVKSFILLAPAFIIFSYYFLEDNFLILPRQRPDFWILLSILYPLGSVIAQTILYRGWFFRRYSTLFNSEPVMIIASAVVFAYGHIVLLNATAMILCFLGGLMFGRTYARTKAFLPVWIEHSLWGVLLFTLGWGRYLYHGVSHR